MGPKQRGFPSQSGHFPLNHGHWKKGMSWLYAGPSSSYSSSEFLVINKAQGHPTINRSFDNSMHRDRDTPICRGRVSAIFGSLFATSSKICTASTASSAPNSARASLQRETATWLYSLSWEEALRSLKENWLQVEETENMVLSFNGFISTFLGTIFTLMFLG